MCDHYDRYFPEQAEERFKQSFGTIKTNNMKNANLYGWVFTFNPTTEKWSATPNSNYFALFNGHNDKVIGSSSITTLMDIINKTNGDTKKIKKLVK